MGHFWSCHGFPDARPKIALPECYVEREFPGDFDKKNRTRHYLRREEGVVRPGWGARGSIAAIWDVSGVAVGLGSTILSLPECYVERHFPADFGYAKLMRRRPRRVEGGG
jgi:hypothetical protein